MSEPRHRRGAVERHTEVCQPVHPQHCQADGLPGPGMSKPVNKEDLHRIEGSFPVEILAGSGNSVDQQCLLGARQLDLFVQMRQVIFAQTY
jgi:hypothetical protein